MQFFCLIKNVFTFGQNKIMDFTFDITHKNRILYKTELEQFSLAELNKIPEGFNNNIIWNIGHAIATQQLLVHRLSGVPCTVSDEFINTYKKGTKPEREITQAEIDEIARLLFSTIDQTKEAYQAGEFKQFNEYTLSTTNGILKTVENAIEFNNYHEGLHLGCILAMKKCL